jgi:hypothetical protein
MNKLKRILQQARDHRLRAGGGVSVELIENLQRYRTQQLIVFVAMELAVIAGVIACAICIVSHPEQHGLGKSLTGVIGIGTGGGLEIMRRTWNKWSQISLLLILLSDASEAQVTTLVDKLIAKL